jgi:hypothetical protein
MTYGDGRWLHHYLTTMNTETELVRGEQEQVMEEFYALLLHTSATHAGFEYCIRPWGTRDFALNLAPHGWFAAKFRTLLRDMLVREQGNDLHLLSAISPEWVKDGNEIVVRRAPTEFGQVNYRVKFSADGATIGFENQLTSRPDKIFLHVPWFVRVRSVRVDGSQTKVQGGTIFVPPNAARVEIAWTRLRSAKKLSFDETVRAYELEYQRRYHEFLSSGESRRVASER